jgi:uncharacterized zinc-type alcohol dehydrogenase-like protein
MGIKAWAALAAKQKLTPFEYEPAPLGDDDVDVKVTHCGICHSDVAMINNDWGWSRYPLVPGHEVIGTVAAIGRNVKNVVVGQRVGVGWQSSSCEHCEWCEAGKQNFCATEGATIIGRHGGWADYVRVQGQFAITIPDALASEHAAPLMCAGTTVFSPMLHFDVKPGMRVAVIGVGGLGHLAVQYLAHFGCEVTAVSSTHDKDEEAKSLGATHFIATKGTSELKNAANRFDFILSTASAGIAWVDAVNALRPGGRLAVAGGPEAMVQIPAFLLIGKEKTVSGARTGSPSDTAQMLDFSARHGIKPMINSFAMKDVNAALEFLESGKARYRVVLTA